eukprot:s4657_g3.t1
MPAGRLVAARVLGLRSAVAGCGVLALAGAGVAGRLVALDVQCKFGIIDAVGNAGCDAERLQLPQRGRRGNQFLIRGGSNALPCGAEACHAVQQAVPGARQVQSEARRGKCCATRFHVLGAVHAGLCWGQCLAKLTKLSMDA